MAQADDITVELRRLLDAVVPPDAERLRQKAAEKGGVRPAECLRQMADNPGSWEAYLAALTQPATWADHERLPPLALPGTVLLGYLLMQDVGGLASRPETALAAAGLWYFSALNFEAASAGGRDPSARLVSPLRHYGTVLKTVARAAAASGTAVAYGLALELAYERAIQSDGKPNTSRVKFLGRTHATVMREKVWPLLPQAEIRGACRLVFSAWVATGDERVLHAGLTAILSTKDPKGMDALASEFGPEGVAFLLHVLRRHRSAHTGGLGPGVRQNLIRLAQLPAPDHRLAGASREPMEVRPCVIELLSWSAEK